MDQRIETRPAFRMVATTLRTSYAVETTPEGKIMNQWLSYFNDYHDKVANKLNGNVYGLYSDYESDHLGEYTLYIGAESDAQVPEGMVEKQVEEAKYLVFTTKPGPMPQVIIDGWFYIWNFFGNGCEYERTFTNDFELYDERSEDQQNAVLEYWIAIK